MGPRKFARHALEVRGLHRARVALGDLHPGEFFGSGTVGNGCGLEHMRFLKPGDVVELEVEGIGILKNRVVR